MIFYAFLLLLQLSSADILTDHLTNNVDVNVNPCDDFYHHVCSQSINMTDFPFYKIGKFYKEIVKNFSITNNTSIMTDIAKLNETNLFNKPYFNRSVFENLLIERCEKNDSCYRQEFEFYYEIYKLENKKLNDRLVFVAENLNTTSGEDVAELLPEMLLSFYENLNIARVVTISLKFYGNLINRLRILGELKERGIIDQVLDIREDTKQMKELIIEKLRKTPWLNKRDNFGRIFLQEFETKINDINIFYDLDGTKRVLDLLKVIEDKYTRKYEESRKRSTGVEVYDIYFSLYAAGLARHDTDNLEEKILIALVTDAFAVKATNYEAINTIAVWAPYIHPALTDNSTLNKPYNLFSIISHEIHHAIVIKDWASRSDAFNTGMECLNDHFNRTCAIFGEGPCISGPQTFKEDGADVEGLRTSYLYLAQNYDESKMKEIVFKSDLFAVTREQAFFYLFGINFCTTIANIGNFSDKYSFPQVRLNGDMTQMPEFANAFSCAPEQRMYSVKERTCHLFGPDA